MNAKVAFLALALAAWSSSVLAQSAIHYRDNQSVDPNEVARILSAPAQKKLKMRSIRLLDQPSAAIANEAAVNSLSIPVRFGFDSSEILPSARRQLDGVAEGIKMLPASQAVVVEGHTDAVGGETYNLELSQRRAAAVKSYLVHAHGIEARRIKHVGFGEYKPIEGADPIAPENRRVQFRGE